MIGVVAPRLDQSPGFFTSFLSFTGLGFFMNTALAHDGMAGMSVALLFFGFHVRFSLGYCTSMIC